MNQFSQLPPLNSEEGLLVSTHKHTRSENEYFDTPASSSKLPLIDDRMMGRIINRKLDF